MRTTERQQLKKSERIVSQKLIDELFAGTGSHTRAAFPLRVVFKFRERSAGQPAAQVLVSVPKRRLRHAVDRNRVKRQVREAYRTNKQLLAGLPEEMAVSMAFIWLSDKLLPTADVVARMKTLLAHVAQTEYKS